MTIEWFDKLPGSEVLPSKEVEGMFLIDSGVPDWVNVPDHPGLPGGQRKVIRCEVKKCARPGHEHLARHYILEGPVSCCECLVDSLFQWYRKEQ